MHSRGFLLLLVVAFVALTSDVSYAKNAVRSTNVETASDPAILSDDSAHRKLKTDATGIDAAALEDEERGIKIKIPSFLSKIFQKSPKASSVVRNSPDIAKGLKDPKVSQTVKALEGKKGFADYLKSLPGVKNIAERLRTKSGPMTSTNVKELGAVAMKSSGTWKETLTHLWVKYGAGFLFGLGIFFLFSCVYHGVFQ
ncbi:hypothetical protein PHYSODRAFT_288817 [Phytophthora sojae]|uniref:RxLR effector protein n=2 Tax=Phytophthora sojae TaxID=67593 RepID=G5A8G0_PHYSP|nr:hypothetical protein PHYSODRAFT_288817 [Phytophthora sojae]AEK80978.1 Avh228 [Phytophthora sojae]AEK80979.1 Avh228 [Phytophthora sojae]AEK80980.1 Avh228 [Phytophthora sojae]EGZ08186.1 hypothetical protein PHYSODRAFT_288817 [Phytophthora sojae]|eukprot:XP_009536358.1 hypothetical protein PHYSODRAFT_288817 [Phytophthora sojae]